MEELDVLRKRLLYQSQHRGMREMDFILGGFAQHHLEAMGYGDLKKFEALLAMPDQELYGWVFKKTPVSPQFQTLLIKIQTLFT